MVHTHYKYQKLEYHNRKNVWDLLAVAVIVGAVAAVAGAGVEAYSASASSTATKKEKDAQEANARQLKLDEAAAATKAAEAVTAERRTLLASGGDTNITGGTANLIGSQTQSKTLIGG